MANFENFGEYKISDENLQKIFGSATKYWTGNCLSNNYGPMTDNYCGSTDDNGHLTTWGIDQAFNCAGEMLFDFTRKHPWVKDPDIVSSGNNNSNIPGYSGIAPRVNLDKDVIIQ